jgi:hypothetical protein
VPAQGRQNLPPLPADTRPRLDRLDVKLRGAPVAVDVRVEVERLGDALTVDKETELANITTDLRNRVVDFLVSLTAPDESGVTVMRPLTIGGLVARLTATERYRVDRVTYTAEFVDEGLRIIAPDVEITPASEQQLWLRALIVVEPSTGS